MLSSALALGAKADDNIPNGVASVLRDLLLCIPIYVELKMSIKIALTVLGSMAVASMPAIAFADDLVVKIGQSVPLTGGMANKGKSAQHGAQLAVEVLNKSSLTVGGRRLQFVLDSEDDTNDPRIGVQIAQRLVDNGNVAVVGPYTSGVTIPSESVYGAAGIPVLTIATNPAVTMQNHENVFRIDAHDGELGRNMARYAGSKLKAKTAAVIDDRTAYGQGVAEQFTRAASGNGLKIVSTEFTSNTAIDFAGILTTLKTTKPDVIFYGGDAAQAGPLAKQMRRLAVNAKLLGGDGICTPNLATLAGDDATSVFCSRGTVDLQKTAEGIDFIARYKTRFNEDPSDYAVNFYDAVMIIGNAVKTTDSTEPKALVKAIRTTPYKGVSATYSWDEHGNLKNAPSTVYTFRDGKMSPVE
jgi:branched-chain amino acid transport system substrate-binding protein